MWTLTLSIACGPSVPGAPPPVPGLEAQLDLPPVARMGESIDGRWWFRGDGFEAAVDAEPAWGPRLDVITVVPLDGGSARPALPAEHVSAGLAEVRRWRSTAPELTVPFDPTETIRFQSPGRYRLVVDSGRIRDGSGVRPVQVEAEITIDPPADLSRAVATSAAVLTKRGSAPVSAARALRTIDTADAAAEATRQLGWHDAPVEEQLVLVIAESDHRETAVRGLENALVHPGRALSPTLLTGLDRLTGAAPGASAARAAEALPSKVGAAAAITAATLLGWPGDAPWRDATRAQVARVLPDAPTSAALVMFRDPGLTDPALFDPIRDWVTGSTSTLGRNEGTRVLLRLDPERARVWVGEILSTPGSLAGWTALEQVPTVPAGAFDAALAARLVRPDVGDARLVERFGSAALLPAAVRALDRLDPAIDREIGVPLLVFSSEHGGAPPLSTWLEATDPRGERLRIGALAALGWTPEIQAAAVRRLDDPDDLLAADAAATLGAHPGAGTDALWARLTRLHDAWTADRMPTAAEVAGALQNGARDPAHDVWWLEHHLIDALRSPEHTDRLATLCVSEDGCRWARLTPAAPSDP